MDRILMNVEGDSQVHQCSVFRQYFEMKYRKDASKLNQLQAYIGIIDEIQEVSEEPAWNEGVNRFQDVRVYVERNFCVDNCPLLTFLRWLKYIQFSLSTEVMSYRAEVGENLYFFRIVIVYDDIPFEKFIRFMIAKLESSRFWIAGQFRRNLVVRDQQGFSIRNSMILNISMSLKRLLFNLSSTSEVILCASSLSKRQPFVSAGMCDVSVDADMIEDSHSKTFDSDFLVGIEKNPGETSFEKKILRRRVCREDYKYRCNATINRVDKPYSSRFFDVLVLPYHWSERIREVVEDTMQVKFRSRQEFDVETVRMSFLNFLRTAESLNLFMKPRDADHKEFMLMSLMCALKGERITNFAERVIKRKENASVAFSSFLWSFEMYCELFAGPKLMRSRFGVLLMEAKKKYKLWLSSKFSNKKLVEIVRTPVAVAQMFNPESFFQDKVESLLDSPTLPGKLANLAVKAFEDESLQNKIDDVISGQMDKIPSLLLEKLKSIPLVKNVFSLVDFMTTSYQSVKAWVRSCFETIGVEWEVVITSVSWSIFLLLLYMAAKASVLVASLIKIALMRFVSGMNFVLDPLFWGVWDSVFSSHIAEAQVITGATAMVSSLATLILYLTTAGSTFKCCTDLVSTITRSSSFVDVVVESISDIIDWVVLKTTGKHFFSDKQNLATLSSFIMELAEFVSRKDIKDKVVTDRVTTTKAIELSQKAEALSLIIMKTDGVSSSMRSHFSSLCSAMRELRTQAETVSHMTQARVEPVVIYLYGAQGQGKTCAIDVICHGLWTLCQNEWPEEFVGPYTRAQTYHRDETSDYWEGYKHQCFTVLNELMSQRNVETRAKVATDILKMAESAPFSLNMAFGQKGTMYFCSSFIIITTNFKDIDQLGLTFPPAFARRMHMPLEVTRTAPLDFEHPSRNVSKAWEFKVMSIGNYAKAQKQGLVPGCSFGDRLDVYDVVRLVFNQFKANREKPKLVVTCDEILWVRECSQQPLVKKKARRAINSVSSFPISMSDEVEQQIQDYFKPVATAQMFAVRQLYGYGVKMMMFPLTETLSVIPGQGDFGHDTPLVTAEERPLEIANSLYHLLDVEPVRGTLNRREYIDRVGQQFQSRFPFIDALFLEPVRTGFKFKMASREVSQWSQEIVNNPHEYLFYLITAIFVSADNTQLHKLRGALLDLLNDRVTLFVNKISAMELLFGLSIGGKECLEKLTSELWSDQYANTTIPYFLRVLCWHLQCRSYPRYKKMFRSRMPNYDNKFDHRLDDGCVYCESSDKFFKCFALKDFHSENFGSHYAAMSHPDVGTLMGSLVNILFTSAERRDYMTDDSNYSWVPSSVMDKVYKGKEEFSNYYFEKAVKTKERLVGWSSDFVDCVKDSLDAALELVMSSFEVFKESVSAWFSSSEDSNLKWWVTAGAVALGLVGTLVCAGVVLWKQLNPEPESPHIKYMSPKQVRQYKENGFAEAQSVARGHSSRMKKRYKKEILHSQKGGRISEAQVEAIAQMSSNIIDRVSMVSRNSLMCRFYFADGLMILSRVFFYGGTVAGLQKHLFKATDAACVQLELIYDSEVKKNVSTFNLGQFKFKDLGDKAQDIMLVIFEPRLMSAMPNLTKFLPRRGNELRLTEVARIIKETRAGKVQTFVKEGSGCDFRSANLVNRFIMNGRTFDTALTAYGVLFNGQGATGQCSCPYVSLVAEKEWLVGLHIAQLAEDSIFTPVYREDVEEFFVAEAQCSGPSYEMVMPDLISGKHEKSKKRFERASVNKGEIPDGFLFEGVLTQPRIMPERTIFEATVFQTRLEEPIFPVTVAPARLAPFMSLAGERVSPYGTGMSKFAKAINPGIPVWLFKMVTRKPSRFFKRYFRKQPKQLCKLSIDQAVFGDPELGIQSLDSDTAGGMELWAAGLKREDILNVENRFLAPWVREEIEKQERDSSKGLYPLHVVATCLKDETRDLDRVERGATRIFCVGSFINLVRVKMNIGMLVTNMKSNIIDTQCAVGVNPHGTDWKYLWSRLHEHGGPVGMCGGDIGSYDMHLCWFLCWLFFEFVNYHYQYEEGSAEWHCLRASCFSICACVYATTRDLYKNHKSNASGNWATGFFNSFCNQAMHRMIFEWSARRRQEFGLKFDDFVKLWVYGDDSLNSALKEHESLWSMLVIRDGFKELFGMEYTDPLKGKVEDPYIKEQDIVFLSRKFRSAFGGSVVLAPLEKDSIYGMLLWTRASKGNTSLFQLETNIKMSAMEMFHYGEEEFVCFEKRVKKYCRECSVAWTGESYAYWKQKYFDNLVIANMPEDYLGQHVSL
jgi:hypothetical protein